MCILQPFFHYPYLHFRRTLQDSTAPPPYIGGGAVLSMYLFRYFLLRYSWMDLAPSLPAPMARITVAAPVTASPPA